MNLDKLIENIMNSYAKDGGVNRSGSESFPNRENVVSVLQDLQCLIFPGFKYDEMIEDGNLKYITGQHVNRVISVLTSEIQKSFVYDKCREEETLKEAEVSQCNKRAESAAVKLIEILPEIRRLIMKDSAAALSGDRKSVV